MNEITVNGNTLKVCDLPQAINAALSEAKYESTGTEQEAQIADVVGYRIEKKEYGDALFQLGRMVGGMLDSDPCSLWRAAYKLKHVLVAITSITHKTDMKGD